MRSRPVPDVAAVPSLPARMLVAVTMPWQRILERRGADAPETQEQDSMSQRQLPIILALGTTQTLAWASSYYIPAILADPIARDLGVSSNWIFGAFSAALVLAALL